MRFFNATHIGWLLLIIAFVLTPAAQAADPTLRWYTLITPHFYVHYYRNLRHDESAVAQQVARAAETAHDILVKALQHQPTSRTHIVITDDTDDANGSAQIVPMNIIRLYMTGPGSLSPLDDYDDWIYGLVLHEYTHILHIDTIHGVAKWVNYVLGKTWAPNQVQPTWFTEGLATYYESERSAGGRVRSTINDMYLRSAVLEGKLLEIDQITATRYFPHGDVPYLYGSRFIKYIADRFGEDKLTRISHLYGGTPIPYAINRIAQEVLGHTYIALYEDFKKYLHQRYARQKRAAEARGLTAFRKIADYGEQVSFPRVSLDGRELIFVANDGRQQTAVNVLDLNSGKVYKQFDYYGGNGVDITPDGQFIIYGGASVWRSFYGYQDLFIRSRKTGHVKQLTRGARARDPAISPDGRWVAYTTSDLGDMNLNLMQLQDGISRVIRRGTEGDQFFTPRWSPDGKWLVYSRWRLGGYRGIYRLEVATGKVYPLIDERSLNTDPVFSRDGQRIYFSSDRTGIFNIYCYDLSQKALYQVSNVLGGAFAPALSADEKQLYYVGFSAQGYDLYRMSLNPRAFQIALPLVDNRPNPVKIPKSPDYPSYPYNPLPTLYPRAWWAHFGTDVFGNVFGLDLNGSDVVGRHRWAMVVNFSLGQSGYPSYGLNYSYNRFWPTLNLDTGRVRGVRGGYVINGVNQNYIEESYNAGASFSLPILRVPHHSLDLPIGYHFTWYREVDEKKVLVDPTMMSPTIPEKGMLSGVSLGLSYNSLESYTWSVSVEKGRNISLSLRTDHPALGSDYQSTQLTYAWQEFLPMPWAFNHVLALRLAGGIGSTGSSRRPIFALGGFPEQDVLRSFFDLSRIGGAFLRGYPPGVVYGDQYHLLNLEYRFPFFNIEKGFSSLPLYFTHVHMTIFSDIGNAFFDEFRFGDLKVGAGAELLIEAVAGYVVPATFRIGYARGFMEKGSNQFHFLLGNSF